MLRRTLGKKGRLVRILPVPWVFDGAQICSQCDQDNRWRASSVGLADTMLSNRRTGHVMTISSERVHLFREPGDLLLRGQLILNRRAVEMVSLPSGYWPGDSRPIN